MVSCETTEGAVLSVNLPRAKAHLSELIDKIENGEDVVITRRAGLPPASARSSPRSSRSTSRR